MRQCAAHKHIKEGEHNDRVILAYMVAILMRVSPRKRLPKPDKFLIRSRAKEPQTQDEQLQIVRMWNAMLGGSVVTNGKVH